MNNYLPLFTSINSIGIVNLDVLDKLQCEYSELAIPLLTSAQILYSFKLVFIRKIKYSQVVIVFSATIAVILGTAIGFRFPGKMESQEFCVFAVATIRIIVNFLFHISSNTSKRLVNEHGHIKPN
jgi:hypothetical protein